MALRAKKKFCFDWIKNNKKKVMIIAGVVVAITGAIVLANVDKKPKETMSDANISVAEKGDVEVVITGSASVMPNERYEIISMVSGDIISSPYDVGDIVTEGDILYQFDTSATDISMEKQRLSLSQSEMNYQNALKKADDLVIKASCDGVISGMEINVKSEVSQGQQIAQIKNSRVMKVVIPFNESQMSGIWPGADATVTSSVNMSTMPGKVTDVATDATPQGDGSKLYDVTIEFENPGAITEGQTVGADVNGMVSPGSGKVTYSCTGTVKSDAEGTVTKIYHSNGDYVSQGEAILVLSSDTVSDNIKSSSISYKNARLSLEEQQKNLEDYSITSPISGTVITKNSKAGDTIDKTNSNTVLMVVADISKLKFDLEIDELDVSKIKQGQTVHITCDALAGEIFYGVISKVSVEGTATNGVTTYTAEVIIDEPGNLRPSMNVDASVIVESAENVLRVPTSDVKTAMGRSFVFVKDEENSDKVEKAKIPEGNRPPEKGGKQAGKDMMPQAPDGFRTVDITVGVVGEDYTEVISGLKEGDIIYSQSVSSEGDIFSKMMSGMGAMGGMSGAPGGMSGGPGGNMGGR